MKYISLFVFCGVMYMILPKLCRHIGSKMSEQNKHWVKGFLTGVLFTSMISMVLYVIHKVEHGVSLSDWL